MRYRPLPFLSASRTCRSMTGLLVFPGSTALRMITGLCRISGGWSHSWLMATRSSTKPRAATISVAPGSREQMRMVSSRTDQLEGFEVVPLQCGRDGIRARELVGRIGRGDRQTPHPGRMGRLNAGDGVFNDEAVRRVDRRPSVQGLQGAQVPFRIGLPVPDVLGCGDVLEAGPQTNGLKN